MTTPHLREVSPGPGFVAVFPGEAKFTVTADQPGDPPRSELLYEGEIWGGWEVVFQLTDDHPSRVVLARWGGLSLEAQDGRARVLVWGRVLKRWREPGGTVSARWALTPAPGGGFLVVAPHLFGGRPPRVSTPGPASHHAGLLWPHPSTDEGSRSVALTRWAKDGLDLL